MIEEIDTTVPPSGPGCVDCDGAEPAGWWVHLRRCAECGHIGCCDSSPAQHASGHAARTGHRYIQSFEPSEDWYYDFENGKVLRGPELAAPTSHPADQPAPGPRGRVPDDWKDKLNH